MHSTFGGALERRSSRRKEKEEEWERRKQLLADVEKGKRNNISLL